MFLLQIFHRVRWWKNF